MRSDDLERLPHLKRAQKDDASHEPLEAKISQDHNRTLAGGLGRNQCINYLHLDI